MEFDNVLYNIHYSFVDKLRKYIVILMLQMELATQKRFCCVLGHNSHDVTACFFMSLFFSDLNLTEEKSHIRVAFPFFCIIILFHVEKSIDK